LSAFHSTFGRDGEGERWKSFVRSLQQRGVF
jgi:hypothetical protein